MLKARAVTSEETRHHLEDAHKRVMSVAQVQQHLHAFDGIDQIEVNSYLSKLCESLGASIIGDTQPIEIKVVADRGMIDSATAVAIGLIVTELVINAIKYAFPAKRKGASVLVSYQITAEDWQLTVSDNGVGKGADVSNTAKGGGAGTAIIEALVSQLEAQLEVISTLKGTSVSIASTTFASHLPQAA